MDTNQNRRAFLGTAAFSIVPRHVLGGTGFVAPSDKITLGYVGVGTQGLREIFPLLACDDIRIVAVCDPNQYASEYRDWSKDGITQQIRAALGNSSWSAPGGGIPGGREVGKDVVDSYYAAKKPGTQKTGCAMYADFREMFDKEKDLTAVKIMTPDHLHGIIAIAAMRKRKHVLMHKPLSNRLREAKMVVDTAREFGVATHFHPWDANGNMEPVLNWIKEGAIGTLREVHNWTARPVWPQFTTLPTDQPPVPKGFDWNLWLGPEAERPYHPNYTHMVFRGWYDFGGGSMADMGHYSLWTVFNALDLSGPAAIEPMLSHHVEFSGGGAVGRIQNDFSFPTSSIVRMRYPAKGSRGPIDLFWYDGGMRPAQPEELDEDRKELQAEGMMFVGDKGKILAGFHVDGPRLIPERRMKGAPVEQPQRRARRDPNELSPAMKQWVEACRGGKQSPGAFLNAMPISEAVNLWAVSLRTRKRIVYDAAKMEITNVPDANRYLARNYRKGWEPQSV